MAKVNLDALIPREDFEVNERGTASQFGQTLQIRDLEKGSFFYPIIRKPDFQRETGDWTDEKVVAFIESFLDGDLIPAIILWQSGTNIFVIDGGHRLSALIAWVHNDYGDGDISRTFFEQKLPEEQIKIADHTRILVKNKVGTYRDLQHAIEYPERSETKHVERARRLGFLALQLQWVKGDSEKAEESFFKINQHAAPINPTELRVLKSRKKPNAIAARAIVRAGTGHKYWSKFTSDNQNEIEKIASEINDLLFLPKLTTPIKTLDLPVAGKGYSASTLTLLLDFINLANNATPSTESKISDDINGQSTILALKNTRKILNRITGSYPSSFGLHPAVYFYSISGRYQPTAFLAVVMFIKWLENENKLNEFISVRERIEAFLLKYKSIPNQITVKLGSTLKGGSRRLSEFYQTLHTHFHDNISEKDLLSRLSNDQKFSFLDFEEYFIETENRNFSTHVKSAVFIKDALSSPTRCGICNGLIHGKSMTIDHIKRKQDGGLGVDSNGQLAHPFCNTTYKN